MTVSVSSILSRGFSFCEQGARVEDLQSHSFFWELIETCVLHLASITSGTLEFYDTSDVVCMNSVEHFMATDVEWDPTGRYVASSVSWWAHKVRLCNKQLI